MSVPKSGHRGPDEVSKWLPKSEHVKVLEVRVPNRPQHPFHTFSRPTKAGPRAPKTTPKSFSSSMLEVLGAALGVPMVFQIEKHDGGIAQRT